MLASALHKELTKPRGFRKRGPTARLVIVGEPFRLLHLLNVQGSSWNSSRRCIAYLNVGSALVFERDDADRLAAYECPFGFRVSHAPMDGLPGDQWLLGDEPDPVLLTAARKQGGAWFDRHTEPISFFRGQEERLLSEPIDTWIGLVETMCRGWVALGEHSKAATVLHEELGFIARERPHADPELVRRFARSLSIDL